MSTGMFKFSCRFMVDANELPASLSVDGSSNSKLFLGASSPAGWRQHVKTIRIIPLKQVLMQTRMENQQREDLRRWLVGLARKGQAWKKQAEDDANQRVEVQHTCIPWGLLFQLRFLLLPMIFLFWRIYSCDLHPRTAILCPWPQISLPSPTFPFLGLAFLYGEKEGSWEKLPTKFRKWEWKRHKTRNKLIVLTTWLFALHGLDKNLYIRKKKRM